MSTRRPLLMMLDCTLRRQLREPTLWLLAGLYLVIVLAVILPIGIFTTEFNLRLMFQSLQVLNLATAIFIAAYGASRVVDDLASGTLELMKVAGLSPGRWISFRFLAIVASYLVVWLLRLPLYSFLLNSGGCTDVDILWSEVIDWAVLIGCAQTSLLIARFSPVESAAMGTSIGLFCAANAALFLPSLAVLMARHLAGFSIPDSLQEIANLSKELSLLTYLFSSPSMIDSQLIAAGAVALMLLLGATATFWLRRLLYVQVEPGATEAAAVPKASKSPTSRPSRRVWDDAFAWHAAEYHFRDLGRRRWRLWLTAVGMVAVGLIPVTTGPLHAMLGFWVIFALAAPGMLAPGCAAMELKQNTLSSLAILPLGGRAIYEGWKRGGDRRLKDAWIVTAVGILVLLFRNPWTAPAWGVIAVVGAYALPPLTFTATLDVNQSMWRRLPRAFLGIGFYWLAQLTTFLGAAALFAVAALCCRPRALRLMDERFESASAR